MECPNEESTWEELADYCWMMARLCEEEREAIVKAKPWFFPTRASRTAGPSRWLGGPPIHPLLRAQALDAWCDEWDRESGRYEQLWEDRKQWLDLWHACRRCKEDEAKQAWIRSPWQQFWSAAWDDSDASALAVVSFTFGVFGVIWQFIKFYIS